MSDFWQESGLEEEISASSLAEGLSSSWINDPDYQALCEDIANLCYELARDRAAIEPTQDDISPYATSESL